MVPFQCPVNLSCIIIHSASIVSIPFIYYSNFENSSKYLFFSISLLCPIWRPILIIHIVSKLGYITLGIGYNSQSLPFWKNERGLTTDLEISTIIFKAGPCAKYMKETNSFENCYVFIQISYRV